MTHEEIETGVCEALAAADDYSFAWIDRRTFSSRHLEWSAANGIDPADAEALVSALAGPDERDEPGDGPDGRDVADPA